MNRHALAFDRAGPIPNSPHPLVLETGAIAPDEAVPVKVESRFRQSGWQGTWTYTVFDYWHFHTEGHEVLACVGGEATIGFGGEEADGGMSLRMRPGDVAIVPAGVGHRRLDGTADFRVAGAYPPGQNGRIVRAGAMDVDLALKAITRLADPRTHPVDGMPFAWPAAVHHPQKG